MIQEYGEFTQYLYDKILKPTEKSSLSVYVAIEW